MTLDAVIRRLDNRARAARSMAIVHELAGDDTAAAASDDAAAWFEQQAAELAFTNL